VVWCGKMVYRMAMLDSAVWCVYDGVSHDRMAMLDSAVW